MKKQNVKRFTFSAILVLFFAAGFAASLLPGGAKKFWHHVYSFCGLNDFSSCADSSLCSVHILDVGKADSILVECGGRFLLVDGGTADRGAAVTAYLKKRGVQGLDYIVNTHPDDDHIGGLNDVLQNFTVRRYFAPDVPTKLIPSSEKYRNVQHALNQKSLKTEHPAAGSVFTLGKLNIQVIGPISQGNSTNNNSLVLRLTYGKTRFLLMGDAEAEEEKSIIKSGRDLSADVLKVGHHGSNTASSQDLLTAVKPKYAAISVGYDSSKLPKRVILKRLAENKISVYRTDVSGTLIFLSDGKTITVKTEK